MRSLLTCAFLSLAGMASPAFATPDQSVPAGAGRYHLDVLQNGTLVGSFPIDVPADGQHVVDSFSSHRYPANATTTDAPTTTGLQTMTLAAGGLETSVTQSVATVTKGLAQDGLHATFEADGDGVAIDLELIELVAIPTFDTPEGPIGLPQTHTVSLRETVALKPGDERTLYASHTPSHKGFFLLPNNPDTRIVLRRENTGVASGTPVKAAPPISTVYHIVLEKEGKVVLDAHSNLSAGQGWSIGDTRKTPVLNGPTLDLGDHLTLTADKAGRSVQFGFESRHLLAIHTTSDGQYVTHQTPVTSAPARQNGFLALDARGQGQVEIAEGLVLKVDRKG
jgi:hypothetical protein